MYNGHNAICGYDLNMAEAPVAKLEVDEYRRSQIIEWDSITQCARFHKTTVAQIKRMIHYGGTLDGVSFFDIPIRSPYDTIYIPGESEVTIIDEKTGLPLDPRRSKKRTVALAAGGR